MIADQEHVDRCLQRRQCSLSLSLSLDHRERERANRRRPILESSPSRRRYTLTGSTVYHRPRLKLREAEDRESKLHTAISADVRPNHLQSRHQPRIATSLWNPLNSTSRRAASLPTENSKPTKPKQSEVKDEYPLLTLSEQRYCRHRSPSSLAVELSIASDPESQRPSFALSASARRDISQGKQPQRAATPPERMAADAVKVSDDPSADKEPPIPTPKDLEGGVQYARSQHSLRSAPSSTHRSNSHAPASPTTSIPWGPSHPCYPHPNPHVPLSSSLYSSTRVIRIRRDWMVVGDLAPTFSNIYPEILEPWVSEQDFRVLIKKVNESLVTAFDPWVKRNWLDGLLGLITGWLWEDFGAAAVKKRVADVERCVDEWNQRRSTEGEDAVKVLPLRRTGYMSLDIQIPDPHIGILDPTPSLNHPSSKPNTRPSTAAGPATAGNAGEGLGGISEERL
ncbi:hypothetical protein MMC20_002723 [Loxospora ochrophaea]|nr:hypothetical protein [Loxospora ochrophaea]